MRNIRLTLLAVLFALSACSFSLSSGPNPYSAYPRTLAGMHGPGKPARRVGREAAPAIAKAERPAKPAKADPEPAPPVRPKRIGRADPPKPQISVGRAELPKPEPKISVGRAQLPKPEPAAKPRVVLQSPTVVDPKAKRPGRG